MAVHLILTGATGTVGTQVSAIAEDQGLRCTNLNRGRDGENWSASLTQHMRDSNENDTNLLLHLANPPQPRTVRVWNRFIDNTVDLAFQADNLGVAFVFASSASVGAGHFSSQYDFFKREIESLILRLGGAIIRLGLVRSTSPDSPYQKWKRIASIVGTDFLASPDSLFFETTDEDIEVWLRGLQQSHRNKTKRIQYVLDPRPKTLADILEEDAHPAGKWVGSLVFTTLTYLASRNARAAAVVDPFLVLHKGMVIGEIE